MKPIYELILIVEMVICFTITFLMSRKEFDPFFRDVFIFGHCIGEWLGIILFIAFSFLILIVMPILVIRGLLKLLQKNK